MRFRSHAFPMLLLHLYLLGRVLEVQGEERGYLQEVPRALGLPLGTGAQPQLHRNQTGVLLTTLLRAVHCAEQTGTSQEACDKVRPATFS